MPSYCSVYGCQNKPDISHKISYHGFPLKKEDLLQNWMVRLKAKRENFVPKPHSKICSKHFEEDCFLEKCSGRRILKPDSVPTIFNYNQLPIKKKGDSAQNIVDGNEESQMQNAAAERVGDSVMLYDSEDQRKAAEKYEKEINGLKNEIYLKENEPAMPNSSNQTDYVPDHQQIPTNPQINNGMSENMADSTNAIGYNMNNTLLNTNMSNSVLLNGAMGSNLMKKSMGVGDPVQLPHEPIYDSSSGMKSTYMKTTTVSLNGPMGMNSVIKKSTDFRGRVQSPHDAIYGSCSGMKNTNVIAYSVLPMSLNGPMCTNSNGLKRSMGVGDAVQPSHESMYGSSSGMKNTNIMLNSVLSNSLNGPAGTNSNGVKKSMGVDGTRQSPYEPICSSSSGTKNINISNSMPTYSVNEPISVIKKSMNVNGAVQPQHEPIYGSSSGVKNTAKIATITLNPAFPISINASREINAIREFLDDTSTIVPIFGSSSGMKNTNKMLNSVLPNYLNGPTGTNSNGVKKSMGVDGTMQPPYEPICSSSSSTMNINMISNSMPTFPVNEPISVIKKSMNVNVAVQPQHEPIYGSSSGLKNTAKTSTITLNSGLPISLKAPTEINSINAIRKFLDDTSTIVPIFGESSGMKNTKIMFNSLLPNSVNGPMGTNSNGMKKSVGIGGAAQPPHEKMHGSSSGMKSTNTLLNTVLPVPLSVPTISNVMKKSMDVGGTVQSSHGPIFGSSSGMMTHTLKRIATYPILQDHIVLKKPTLQHPMEQQAGPSRQHNGTGAAQHGCSASQYPSAPTNQFSKQQQFNPFVWQTPIAMQSTNYFREKSKQPSMKAESNPFPKLGGQHYPEGPNSSFTFPRQLPVYDQLYGPQHPHQNTMERESNKKLEIKTEKEFDYDILVALSDVDLVSNWEHFQCPRCLLDVEAGEGATLQNCLHCFCRQCLADAIRFSVTGVVKCPFQNSEYSCESHLREREVKSLVTSEIYEQHIQRGLVLDESQTRDRFYCKTPNCPGRCLLEDNVNTFLCPICRCTNCLACAAIHEGKNCIQYRKDLNSGCNSEKAIKTEEQLQNEFHGKWKKAVEKKVDYQALLALNDVDLVANVEKLECPICFLDVEAGDGVTLQDCLHSYCRECLAGAIQFSETPDVKCPFQNDDYSCESHLREREIKSLVTAEVYERHLQKGLTLAENQAQDSFHCKTPDCPGWCFFEDNVNIFPCPVCKHTNCLTCAAIHEGRNCLQYQEYLSFMCDSSEEARRTKEYLQSVVDKGEAMRCPKCQVILMKKEGCDWLKCSMCHTEVCWVTKGPRWGPLGNGDTSGGCKCKVNGVSCHPKCNNCH